MTRALRAVALALAAASAAAQSPPQKESPPAAAPAGAVNKPAGALKGGSLEPYIGESAKPRRDVKRCHALKGRLREECLRDLRDPSDAPPSPPRANDDHEKVTR